MRRINERISVSPQIASEDVPALAEQGFALVISNRPDGEEPGQPTAAEISDAARAAGLGFRHIPVASAFPEASIEAMVQALAEARGPVLAFCRSGTRSTLLWALAQASSGSDPEALAELAAGAGYDVSPVRAAMDALSAR
jgi:uncharacterized protein (TIGR01244 family)